MQKNRTGIDDKYKWNLNDLFSSSSEWKAELESIKKDIESIPELKKDLTSSADSLCSALDFFDDLQERLYKASCYASMNSDTDTRVSEYLGMKQSISAVGTLFAELGSYLEPSLSELTEADIDEFASQNRNLDKHVFYLKDVLRRSKHRLSENEERLLASAGSIARTPYDSFNVLSNAELPYPEYTLKNGKTVRLDQETFSLCRRSKDREERKEVFEKFFSALSDFRRTFASQLHGNIQKDVFYSKSRKYTNSLEASLDSDNIPCDVYHSLIRNVRSNLPVFHRYLKLRQKALGLNDLHYYDLYADLDTDIDKTFSYEEAVDAVIDSVRPLGEDYISVVKRACSDRWIDVYPSEGKSSGAYSNGSAYSVHPYILLNFNGTYNDVSTLTHELGHTMHSYYSNKNQPFCLSHYSIFAAEVASTFNEALLIKNELSKEKDDKIKKSLLLNYLDGIKGTLFRQTQFAEFELRIHEEVEKGNPLNDEILSEIYLSLAREYYGHEDNVCIVDDNIKYEWAYIPHFYYNFYVFQYATSFTASAALAEMVLNGDDKDRESYFRFLSAGGSDYPVEILKKAGVDMTTSLPFNNAIKLMGSLLDQLEGLL